LDYYSKGKKIKVSKEWFMWPIGEGQFWQEINALILVAVALWGIAVAIWQRFRTHEWRWKGKTLTFPYRDFSEYACGLADGTP
jgi:hypothetical protein